MLAARLVEHLETVEARGQPGHDDRSDEQLGSVRRDVEPRNARLGRRLVHRVAEPGAHPVDRDHGQPCAGEEVAEVGVQEVGYPPLWLPRGTRVPFPDGLHGHLARLVQDHGEDRGDRTGTQHPDRVTGQRSRVAGTPAAHHALRLKHRDDLVDVGNPVGVALVQRADRAGLGQIPDHGGEQAAPAAVADQPGVDRTGPTPNEYLVVAVRDDVRERVDLHQLCGRRHVRRSLPVLERAVLERLTGITGKVAAPGRPRRRRTRSRCKSCSSNHPATPSPRRRRSGPRSGRGSGTSRRFPTARRCWSGRTPARQAPAGRGCRTRRPPRRCTSCSSSHRAKPSPRRRKDAAQCGRGTRTSPSPFHSVTRPWPAMLRALDTERNAHPGR